MTDRKKPGVAFWGTVVVAALALYVASFGPACWALACPFGSKQVKGPKLFEIAYWPLGRLIYRNTPVTWPLIRYAGLWIEEDRFLIAPGRGDEPGLLLQHGL